MSLDATRENIFQNDMTQHMQANGWYWVQPNTMTVKMHCIAQTY